MKEIKLDKWELQLIHAIKQERDCLTKCREIWAERGALEIQYVNLEFINRCLCDLALEMGLIDVEFIMDLNPSNNWKFGPMASWNELLFSRVASLFRLLEIKHIPGYKEYFNLEN